MELILKYIFEAFNFVINKPLTIFFKKTIYQLDITLTICM